MDSWTSLYKIHNMKKLFITISILFLLPTFVSGQSPTPKLDYSGFVKCDGVVKSNYVEQPAEGEEDRQRECDFNALMDTLLGAINWIFMISVPIAATLFAYGGLLYMTGQSGKIETAKKIFSSVAIGFIIMITAWFAVRTVVDWFVKPTSGANFFLKK